MSDDRFNFSKLKDKFGAYGIDVKEPNQETQGPSRRVQRDLSFRAIDEEDDAVDESNDLPDDEPTDANPSEEGDEKLEEDNDEDNANMSDAENDPNEAQMSNSKPQTS